MLARFLNSNMEFDSIDESILSEKLEGDPNWDQQKALICLTDEKILGFLQGVVRDIKGTRYGYIKLMAVDESYRRKGVARALYTLLESKLLKEGVDRVRIYDVPMNYFMPGIDPRYTEAVCFALRMGFQRFGDTSNLLVDLNVSEWDTRAEELQLKSESIEISRCRKNEQELVLDFVQKDWALWVYEVKSAFLDDPPSIHIAKQFQIF